MGKSKQIATMLTDAPAALDTLDELAAALGDDANFATTVTNSIATKLDISNPVIDMGTNKKIEFIGNIGEIGSVPGFQARNDAGTGLRSMGLRGTSLRFATGSNERLRIDDGGRIGIGVTPNSNISASTFPGNISLGEQGVLLGNATSTQIGHNFYWDGSAFKYLGSGKASRIYQQSGEIVLQTTDDNGATDNNLTTLTDRLKIDSVGNIGIGISPGTTAGVNYARLVIDADSSTYPKSLEINATNSAGPNFSISSYSDNNGSYYLLGANLQLQSNGNFAWETNGEHMAGVTIDSRNGHGVTFVDSYYDSNTTAYVPAEIGKVNTSTDGRADITVDATGLAGDGGVNANAFFNAKAKGNYYAGLDIKSNSGHVGGWIGHWNGGATSRALLARVGGSGINAGGDVTAIYADYAGRVTHPNRPHFKVRAFNAHYYVNVIQGAQNSRLRDWKHIDTNRGSHFDNSTGKFTIPVTGDYCFYCNVMFTNPSVMDFHLGFDLNGAVHTYSNDHNGGGSGNGHSWNGTTLTVSGYFTANDYVGFGIYGGGSTSNTYLYGSSGYNIMGGYLL